LHNIELISEPLGILLSYLNDPQSFVVKEIMHFIPKFSSTFYLELAKKRLEILKEKNELGNSFSISYLQNLK